MSRRALVPLAAAIAAVGPLAACAVADGGAPAAKQLAPATLTYTTFQLPPGAAGAAMEKALRDFERRNTGVTVTVEGLTSTVGGDLEKLQTLLAAGTPPDLSLTRQHHLGFFAALGAFVAIDDRLSKDKRAPKNDFVPAAVDRVTWNGKTWSLPAEMAYQIGLYNEDLFVASGERPPDESWTWDRWLETAVRLATKGAFNQPKTLGADVPQWEVPIWAWGGELLNAAGTECVMNRPPTPEAMQWRADALTKHTMRPTNADLNGQSVPQFFSDGRLGMFMTWNNTLSTIGATARIKWGVVVPPQGKAGSWTFGAGANYSLFQGTKHVDAAWTLASDLVAGEGQKILLANSSMYPALRSMAKPELMPSYKPEWLKVTLKAGERARQPHYNHPKWVEFDRHQSQQLAPLWRGEKSAQAATDELVRLVNPLLKQS